MTGTEIRQLRAKLTVTQPQLAHLLGVHAITVSKWERGHMLPRPYEAALLATFRRASEVEPGIGRAAVAALMDEGVSRALYLVLRSAFADKEP